MTVVDTVGCPSSKQHSPFFFGNLSSILEVHVVQVKLTSPQAVSLVHQIAASQVSSVC